MATFASEIRPLRKRSRTAMLLLRTILAVGVCLPVLAQERPPQENRAKPALIEITLPPETELRMLVDFVSKRLGVQILYDEGISNKKITINAPQPIPADTLLDILKSALKMKGMALVDAEVKGWKRIVMADDLARIAEPHQKNQSLDDYGGTTAVTQAFPLTHMTPERVKTIVEPFLTKQGANSITLPDKNILIVTDYSQNLKRISQLIAAIDQSGPERVVKFYPVKHVNAEQLSLQVTQSLAARMPPQPGMAPVSITSDKRTNQLLIVGTAEQIEQVLRLTKAFDVTLEQRTQIYSFRYIAAERVDRLVKDIFDPLTVERLYRSSIDRDDNLLIATGTEEIHKRIEWFRKELDVASKRPGSGVRFFRLKYADAEEVLNTLRAIEQRNESGGVSGTRRGQGGEGIGNPRGSGPRDAQVDYVPGRSNPNQSATPPSGTAPPPGTPESAGTVPSPNPPVPGNSPTSESHPEGSGERNLGTIVPGAARVSADPNTNSIIVIGDRGVQAVYEELIQALDKRRPQVMIEAKVVILDTSDNFSLGVEVSGGDRSGLKRLFQFTSYGLSTVTPANGALALIPGQGFNWTLVDPKSADAVIRALSNHRRSKVLSAPRILVNDNATGTLSSVTEVPFTSVNASTTVATTSFAGFAKAGTTIEATPRITDDDHLQLEYSVALNSFNGAGTGGVPPPRQTDQVQSHVTVPDGYTVIVGGLTRQNLSRTIDSVPYLEYIPILRQLASSQSQQASQTTLFVFLRPVILRDDKFRDLKYFSDRDLPRATEPGNTPASAPLLIR